MVLKHQILSTIVIVCSLVLNSCDSKKDPVPEWTPVERGNPALENDSTALGLYPNLKQMNPAL